MTPIHRCAKYHYLPGQHFPDKGNARALHWAFRRHASAAEMHRDMQSTTLTTPHCLAQEIRKSRFVAHAAPVADEDEALAFIAAHRDATATHNCWAWRIGERYRSNDDGEPGGTAGRPILAAIDGQGLDQVVVLVIRWFGGIKLGAGGLLRAYGGTAAECLRVAERRTVIRMCEMQLRCGFEHTGVAHTLMQQHQACKIGENYQADGLLIRLSLPAAMQHPLADALRDATRGQAHLLIADDENP